MDKDIKILKEYIDHIRLIESQLIREQTAFDEDFYNDVNSMRKYLDFPTTKASVENAHNLLIKYYKNGRGKDFLDTYEKSGLGGGSLEKTLKNVWSWGDAAKKARIEEMINTIEWIKQGTKPQDTTSTENNDNDKNTDVIVTWNDAGGGEEDNNKKREEGKNQTTTPTPTKKGQTYPIPLELKDRSGVVKFQTWVEDILGKPELLGSKGVDGWYGINTKGAWEDFGSEYLKQKPNVVTQTKPTTQTKKEPDYGAETTARSSQGGTQTGASGDSNKLNVDVTGGYETEFLEDGTY
jgi:hypothetical protein